MRILLTGANGYIGKRLIPPLIEDGHEIICCVRDKHRFPEEGIYKHPNISILETDFTKSVSDTDTIKEIDVAYYFIHSLNTNIKDFEKLEEICANNFIEFIKPTSVKQIIYLSGITNEKKLSKHLSSRKNVEKILSKSNIPLTSLKAGIIVGSGSASFEIIRDIVEKLPIIPAPVSINTRCQPIAIRNVLEYLTGVLLNKDTLNKSFDIGGQDILTYKEMLLQFAEVRKLRRFVLSSPIITPRIMRYFLYFLTSTPYWISSNLVESMKVEVVAKKNNLKKMLGIEPFTYKEAVELAFQKIEQNNVVSSWKDAVIISYGNKDLLDNINIPSDGCLCDIRLKPIKTDINQVLKNIWSIGGERGWYYGNWLWEIRGFIDKLVGGVGLRRGRTNANAINTGDTLDFWRVLVADKQNKRLLLYAEMKLPGEAWLEFKIIKKEQEYFLQQTATFRPKGLPGRLYWYGLLPIHSIMFNGLAKNIIRYGI